MSDKKAAGQARKAAASDVKKAAEQGRQEQLEDADWEEGAKGKNKKAEAAEAKAAAAAERKALAKAQEDEENAQLSKPVGAKNKKAAAGASKMTRAEIAANVRGSAPLLSGGRSEWGGRGAVLRSRRSAPVQRHLARPPRRPTASRAGDGCDGGTSQDGEEGQERD